MTQTRDIRPLREVTIVSRNPEIGRALAEVLRHAGAELHLVSDRLGDERPGARLPELAILDVDLADAGERRELERVLETFGDRVAFVVTSPTPTVEGMRTLLRHGIVDLLPQPLVAEEVLRAVVIALDPATRFPAPGKATANNGSGVIVSVIRAGGGVGATAIATQAACAAAKAPEARGRVCLLDFDLQFGSAAFHLALPQLTSLLDLIAAGDRFDGAMFKTAMARHPSGIDVLPAPPGIHPLDALPVEFALTLLVEARRTYMLTVVDHPGCWTAWSRAVLAESDRIVLVLQPTMPSLRHAKRQIETLHEEGLGHVPLCVVANRVQRGLFNSGPAIKDMEAAIGRRIDHLVASDDQFKEAVDHGKTLADLGAHRTVKRLAALVAGLVQPASA